MFLQSNHGGFAMTVPELWKSQVEEYRNSGMQQGAWCQNKGISLGTFQYRLKKVKAEKPIKFRELPLESRSLRLRWKNLSLELEEGFNQKTLEELLLILARLP